MGVASSKVTEDDKVLVLCQERKRFVREAIDGRCALASAHYDYTVSLRNTGSLLRKCFDGENPSAYEDCSHNPSTETSSLVSDNRKCVYGENILIEQSTACHASENMVSENFASENRLKGKRRIIDIITNEKDETPAMTPVNAVPSSDCTRPTGSKESYPDVSNVVKDLSSGMKQIEILFFRACESGEQVPMILEENKIQFRPLLPEEIAHGSRASNFLAKFLVCCREEVSVPEPPPQADIKYLTWHRSVSSQLSPSRDLAGTILDIHTSTLDRLYAWETKLYDEVKGSSNICRRYDEKCKQLSDQESRGKNQIITDFTRATVKDLHSRVLVAIEKIDFISKKIEDLRDNELQPQLDELIENLTRMWATMLECHRHQHAIIKLLSSSSRKVEIPFESESQCQAALLLSVELTKLRSNLQNWITSHKAYLRSLNLWLHRCMKPLKKRKSYSRKQNVVVDVSLTECAVAPIFATCEMWMRLLDELPTHEIEEAIEGLIADIGRHLPGHLNQRLDQTVNGEEGAPGNDATTDLQSSLVTFIAKLEGFSEISVEKYIDLQKGVAAAKYRLLVDA